MVFRQEAMVKKGFTLIEILVVIAIGGILMAFSIAASIGVKKNSRDAQRKAAMEEIRSALEMYRTDAGIYPEGMMISGAVISYNGEVYLKIPDDPLSTYRYSYNGTKNGYTACAILEAGISKDDGSTGCNYAVSAPGTTANISNCASCLAGPSPE